MKSISLKVDDDVFEDMEKIVAKAKVSRNRYINNALKHYNSQKQREALAEKLKKESLLVRDESLKVLHEFEALEDND